MLVSCGNPNCHIQYAGSLRACPVCSTPKLARLIGADTEFDQRAGMSLMGAAVTANLFAIAIGAVMTFVWGRLAVTAFEENSVK
jgi:hypothetical protein